ncbi:MAG: class I SAM-dependent methyltransferase [Chitinophagales bacterium]|nr:class I SAM-dependent methyltransferase [Chitinophagales bacterium]
MPISKWHLKAVIQKTISWLPYSQSVNFFFQKYVTKGVQLSDDYFTDRLQHAKHHINGYEKYTHLEEGNMSHTLEIGTGWYPVVPVAMYLCGATQINTLDISSLMTRPNLITTLKKYQQYADQNLLTPYINPLPERLAKLSELLLESPLLTLEQLLNRLQIRYLVADARQLPLPDGSIDLIHSNNTFEHIYPQLLLPILYELKRVARPISALQSHAIDMSDHFAHLDTKITIYNFLKFTEKQWACIDNNIQPQSRLRYSDYLKLFAQVQLPIVGTTYRPGDITQVKAMRLAEPYTSYSPQDLAISHCHIYSAV